MRLLKYFDDKINDFKYAVKTVFLTLILLFFMIAGAIVVPEFRRYVNFYFINISGIIFSLLGALLILLVVKKKIRGALKWFLILTGISASGFFISVFLHNFIYGLMIFLFGSDFWNVIGLPDEPLFFILAILVFPAGFLIGVIGTLITFIKEKKQH